MTSERPAGRSTGLLDYGWWASDGPTAGYLFRLALQAVEATANGDIGSPRWIDLRVVRGASAAPFSTEVTLRPFGGGTRLSVATIAFRQREQFAEAIVHISPSAGLDELGDAEPPDVLPFKSYPPLAPMDVPVTSNFNYRPVIPIKGVAGKSGWDLVWIEPKRRVMDGAVALATMVDCWLPAYYARAIARFMTGGTAKLEDPPPSILVGGQLSFTAPESAYKGLRTVLLASRVESIVQGHSYERLEMWSQDSRLLASALLVRRTKAP